MASHTHALDELDQDDPEPMLVQLWQDLQDGAACERESDTTP